MKVLVDRKLPEQQPGARDNSVLCVPLMESEDRLTACLFLIVPMAKNTPVKRAGRQVAGLHTGMGSGTGARRAHIRSTYMLDCAFASVGGSSA
jgi:hypothetical protein